MKKKGLFLFADYYDSTTTIIRVLSATKDIFDEIDIVYWARLGTPRESEDKLYNGIKFTSFNETSPPRSFAVLILFLKFQLFLLKQMLAKKPKFVVAFTFYTILPALLYKYIFFNWKCKVIYDPRDYAADSYGVNSVVRISLRLIDNIFIKLSNFVIFPDNQYFIYYGMFKLRPDKYLILPNSTGDLYDEVLKNDIFKKYKIAKDKYIIPVLGYFSETRGEKILFELIKKNNPKLLFVFAGDIREDSYLQFFKENANVLYLNKIPYLDALTIMKESLLCPQLYDPNLKNNVYALPTKYYDCLMVGTPVVVSTGQIDVAQEIIKNDFGWAINYEKTEELENIINLYIETPSIIEKSKLRNFFLSKYDYNIYKIKLRNLYLQYLE